MLILWALASIMGLAVGIMAIYQVRLLRSSSASY